MASKMSGEGPVDIFLSYKREEKEDAQRFVDAFKEEGFSVWWDRDISGSEAYRKRIAHHLKHSHVIVTMLTPMSIASDEIFAEVDYAINTDKYFQILFRDIPPADFVPPYVGRQYFKLVDWRGQRDDEVYQTLVGELKERLQQAIEAPQEPTAEFSDEKAALPNAAPSKEEAAADPAEEDEAEAEADSAADAIVREAAPAEVDLPDDEKPLDTPVAAPTFPITDRQWDILGSWQLVEMALRKHDMAAIRDAARSRDPASQTIIGIAHAVGCALDINHAAAQRWLNRAAQRNFGRAATELVWLLSNRRRTDERVDKTRSLLALARDNGSVRADTISAILNLRNYYDDQEDRQAATLLQECARNKDMMAAGYYGWCLLRGVGVRRDNKAAARWLQLSAEAGDPLAQVNLGTMYGSGRGVRRDPAKAVYWFRRSAQQGHPWGEFYFGWANETGTGLNQDASAARVWYARAAAKNDPDAQFYLARLLLDGKGGMADVGQAVDYLEHAAHTGNARAQTLLGEIYEAGRGVERDYAKAVSCYETAAKRHDPRALLNLALMLEWGRGVSRDLARAKSLFEKAADQTKDVGVRFTAQQKLRFLGAP